MVVPKRGTGGPPSVSAASRTNSSQGTPRASKGKAPQRHSNAAGLNGRSMDEDESHSTLDGPQFSDDVVFAGPVSPKKGQKSKTKAKTKRERRRSHSRESTSWLDLAARMFLLFFFIYSASVCPNDKQLDSAVCRGLAEYRRLVVEPYIIPPFQRALNHPSVLPVVAWVKPKIETTIEYSKPILEQSKREWKSRVVPHWNRAILPRLRRVEAFLLPYQEQVSAIYQQAAAPYVASLQRYSRKTQPYLLMTAARTYDTYTASKPYLNKIIVHLQRIPPIFYSSVVRPLVVARRQFVDRHVAQMVDTIKELSRGRPDSQQRSSTLVRGAEFASQTHFYDYDDDGEVGAAEIRSSSPSKAVQETISVASVADKADHVSELNFEGSESGPGMITTEVTSDADGPSSNPSTDDTPGALPSTNPNSSSPPAVVETATTASLTDHDLASAASTSPPSNAVKQASDDNNQSADIDLDDFVKDLGLDLDDPSEQLSPADESPSAEAIQTGPSEEGLEEERRQKQEENAQKRQEIESRHTKWEAKVAEAIVTQREVVQKALTDIRNVGATELQNSQQIRKDLDSMHGEADKAIRGTEAYFAKLKAENRSEGDKAKLWDRVLTKVWDKFQDRVKALETTINTWYDDLVAKETEQIESAATVVKSIAEEGQADIGLDYAWLDDVSYLDWRRYHALLDNHKIFLDQAWSLQNGTDPSAPSNPIDPILDDLQLEIKDVIISFETRFRRMKRAGERVFASVSDASKSDEDSEAEVEPEASTLPVPSEGSGRKIVDADGVQEVVAEAILGRGEEEVREALLRAKGADDGVGGKKPSASKIAHLEL